MDNKTLEITGRIFDIKNFSVHDGPGIRTTVFMKGCPLRCKWCHNPEGIRPEREVGFIAKKCMGCGSCFSVCPKGVHTMEPAGGRSFNREKCGLCGACVEACFSEALLMYGKNTTVSEVCEQLLQDVDFYRNSGGGITLSGGEPLTQPDFAAGILKTCVENGLHTAVDTCGFVHWSSFEKVIPYTKMFLYDLKHFDEALHIKYTGVSNKLIIQNLKELGRHEVPVEIRIPVIPGFNETTEYAGQIGKLLSEIPVITAVRLLPYHALSGSKYDAVGMEYTMPETQAPSDEMIEQYADVLEKFGLKTIVPHEG